MKTLCPLSLCIALSLFIASSATGDIITATLKFSRTQDLLTNADRAAQTGDTTKALTLYKEVLNSFADLMAEDPDFQPNIIEARMEYCDQRMAGLLGAMQAEATATNSVPEPSRNPRPSVDVSALLTAARNHLEEGEPEAARAEILQGFKLDPDNVELRLLAGLAQCQARRFGDAIFLLKELAIEEPSNAPVRIGLAAAYIGDGQRDSAMKELKTAITLAPSLAESYYDMAQLLMRGPQPDIEGARAAYQRALTLGATPDPRIEAALKPTNTLIDGQSQHEQQ